MKKFKLITKPTNVHDLNFDDLYDQISHDLDSKIASFQARHRHKLMDD